MLRDTPNDHYYFPTEMDIIPNGTSLVTLNQFPMPGGPQNDFLGESSDTAYDARTVSGDGVGSEMDIDGNPSLNESAHSELDENEDMEFVSSPKSLVSNTEPSPGNSEDKDEGQDDEQDQDAIDDFNTWGRESPLSSSSDEDEDHEKAKPPAIAYALRTSVRKGSSLFAARSTWMDQDQSGNYDPSLEGKKQLKLPKKKNLDRLAVGNEDLGEEEEKHAAPKEKRTISWEMARRTGQTFIVTLHFKSENSLKWLKDNDHKNNWPEDPGDNINNANTTATTETTLGLRRRRTKREQIRDPLGIQEDLFGHPEARGCFACREANVDCPLARDEDDAVWPCQSCVASKRDCQLLTPPTVKQRCERCKRDDTICSYEETDAEIDYNQPCDHCLAQNQTCIAGPVPGLNNLRASYRKWEATKLLPPPTMRKGMEGDRRFVKCTACRQEKKSCSLKSKMDPPPCKACLKRKIPCTFDEVVKTNKGKRPVGLQTQAEEHDADGDVNMHNSTSPPDIQEVERRPPPSPPAFYMHDSAGHWGPVSTILTSFSHPIHFLWSPPPPRANFSHISYISRRQDKQIEAKCNFHTEPLFGALGWGFPRKVQAINWSTGLGHTELFFGYISEGFPHTFMCVECSEARIQISLCPSHLVLPLDPQPMDTDAAMARLSAGEALENEHLCSICINVAMHECKGDLMAEAAGPCGLMLCESCKDEFISKYSMDFDRFVTSMERSKMEGSERLRADVGFLTMEGLLMRNFEDKNRLSISAPEATYHS